VRAQLASPQGHSAELLLHGAQLISWFDGKGDDLFFVSSKAQFVRGKPVRGGIPLIFPQFGKGELPSHGFARTSMWDIKGSKIDQHGVHIVLALQDSKASLELWPHPFSLELTVTLGDTLKTQLKVHNCGTTPFFFFAGFHSYFRVADVRRVQVLGLKDVTFMDQRRAEKSYRVLQPEALIVDEEVDYVFLNAPQEVQLVDQLYKRAIHIKKENIKDIVVWNPWTEKSKQFTDLGAEEFHSFVCVEPAIVNQKITLEPRASYVCAQELSVTHL
jgi:glucose-6-phosphate 1-epimerase